MAYLYILRLRDGTHYCGIARNVVKRLQQHQKGRSKSTRLKRPLVTKFIRQFVDIKSARIEEVRIKKQGVTRWFVKYGSTCNEIARIQTANSQQPTA